MAKKRQEPRIGDPPTGIGVVRWSRMSESERRSVVGQMVGQKMHTNNVDQVFNDRRGSNERGARHRPGSSY